MGTPYFAGGSPFRRPLRLGRSYRRRRPILQSRNYRYFVVHFLWLRRTAGYREEYRGTRRRASFVGANSRSRDDQGGIRKRFVGHRVAAARRPAGLFARRYSARDRLRRLVGHTNQSGSLAFHDRKGIGGRLSTHQNQNQAWQGSGI